MTVLGAAIKKDVILVLHDRGALASLFLLPIIFMAVFGSMFSAEDDDSPRVLPTFHPAGDPIALPLVTAINGSGLFRVERRDSPEEVREAVASGVHLAGLILAADFDPGAGKPAELVIDEGLSPQLRGPIEGALAGIITIAHFGAPAGGPVRVLEARTPPGIDRPLEGSSGFQVSVPGNAVLFGFFLALTVALSFVEERRAGTWRRLLAAPVSRPALLLARLVPFFVIGLMQMAFLFTTGTLVFGMEIAGSIPGLITLTAAVVFCATALGLFIAAFGGTEKQVGGIGSICLLVLALLGGSMVPRPAMPDFMQNIGLFTPHAWALDGYYDLIIRPETSWLDVWQPTVAVVGFGLFFAAIGTMRFRFER